MNLPAVSVIVPTYNRAETLVSSLKSCYLVQQGVSEVIVVNDGSSDSTETLLKAIQSPLLKVLNLKQNCGLPTARNLGLSQAKERYVFFGEDDLFVGENHVVTLLKEMLDHNHQIIASRLLNVAHRDMIGKKVPPAHKTLINESRISGNFDFGSNGTVAVPFIHACSLIDTVATKGLRYRSVYKGNSWREETDFYLRCRELGLSIAYTDKVVSYHLKDAYTVNTGCANNNKLSNKLWKLRNNFMFLFLNRNQVRKINNRGVSYNFIRFLVEALGKS